MVKIICPIDGSEMKRNEGDPDLWYIGKPKGKYICSVCNFEIPIKYYDHDSETLSLWKNIAYKTDKQISQVMDRQIKKVRTAMNVDYGVLNGEKDFSGFVKSGKEKLKDLSHILIFTDGLFIPSSEPQNRNNFDEFVDLFFKGGLTEIRNHVRNIEQSDPDCRVYPRFKTHDDIAAVALTI